MILCDLNCIRLAGIACVVIVDFCPVLFHQFQSIAHNELVAFIAILGISKKLTRAADGRQTRHQAGHRISTDTVAANVETHQQGVVGQVKMSQGIPVAQQILECRVVHHGQRLQPVVVATQVIELGVVCHIKRRKDIAIDEQYLQ